MSHRAPSPDTRRPRSRTRSRRRRRSVGGVIVGTIGELLVTAGVLIGLFVLWQLWWTDVVALREQREMLVALEWAAPPTLAEIEAAPPSPERRDDIPVLPEPEFGEIFGQIYIPRFGTDFVTPLAGGVDRRQILDVIGVGHFPDTAMPGDLGNFATAGHRTTFGRPYNLIAELQPGDAIVIRTADYWYVYRHVSSVVVYPRQVEVISPIPYRGIDGEFYLRPGDLMPEHLTERWMTLASCHPMFSARERFVAHAIFDFWMPVSEGIPAPLLEAGVQIIGWEGN